MVKKISNKENKNPKKTPKSNNKSDKNTKTSFKKDRRSAPRHSKKDKIDKTDPEYNDDNEEQGNKADFYLDDRDADLAEEEQGSDKENESINSGSLDGSELDFGEEDYESEQEGDFDEDEVKKSKKTKAKKEKPLTKEELKKILKKSKEGAVFALTKIIIIFNKITSLGQKSDALDVNNVLNNPVVCNKIIKFCVKNLSQILLLKYNSINEKGVKEKQLDKSSVIKNLIKRYLASLSKFLKSSEGNIVSFVYKDIDNLSSLIPIFKNYIEIFLKISVNVWATYKNKNSNASENAMKLIKSLLTIKPEYFEICLKFFYINYLDHAKAMNWGSLTKINLMQNDIIDILSLDLQKAYLTIFSFIRKLCLQLRATINDKKAMSIKNIYNWQFINSILLWNRAVCKYYNKNSEIDLNLLAYPLIQTIIGVIRLNLVDVYFPLRLILVNALNDLSYKTNIFIPVSVYLIEILENSDFHKQFREKNVTTDMQVDDYVEDKYSKLNKKQKQFDLNVTLKIKKEDFKKYGNVIALLEETLDSLKKFLAINSHKISFCELSYEILYNLKKIKKNIHEKIIREMIKNLIENLNSQIDFIENSRKSLKTLTDVTAIKKFESKFILFNF